MKAPRIRRRGAVLVLVAISLVVLIGFVGLAIDLGVLALAKVDCQNAADAAAMAGVRSIDGSAGGNLSAATANAIAAAASYHVIGQAIQTAEVSVRHGAYHYDSSSQQFYPTFPPVSPDNYNLTQVTVAHQVSAFFSRVFHASMFTISVQATAAYEPRDVAIVLDYSGSMNNESDLWNNESYLGSASNSPNNTDTVYPQFGPYAPSFSSGATLQCTSSDARVGKCNITVSVLGIPAMVNDFYQNAAGASANPAFSTAPAGITNTQPGGDLYRMKSGSSTIPAINWQEITNNANSPPTSLYTASGGNPYGYTRAAGYWGKTFFIWPPDPRSSYDWRKKFFFLSNGTTPLNDDTHLWDTSGNWLDPPGYYVINYKAILAWIKASPGIFPPVLRAGGILYYSSIPTDVPASVYDHTKANQTITDPSQRFWKEYIDFTIGVWRDPLGTVQHPGNPSCSYGPDFTCGSGGTSSIQITGPDKSINGSSAWIAAKDNPKRPRHRLWFGPMTMIQYLSDTGLLPGTAHDISLVAAKLGIGGALQDIENNHPNDLVSLLMFSRPNFQGEPTGVGQFSVPRMSLGHDYTGMINALWFPPTTNGADVRPWDSNDQQTPRAHGDYNSNTATDYGLMLAYNQFSGNSALRSSGMGGWGRKGARKLVILETDGMANVATTANVTNNGAYQSYYNVGPLGSITPSGSVTPAQGAINVATQICALDSGGSGLPGYAQSRKPVVIQCIAFGAIFEPTASGSEQTSAVALLQQLSSIGGTVFPSSASDPTNGYKWCIGTLSQRQDKLRQAFTKIMDDTISVVLVQ